MLAEIFLNLISGVMALFIGFQLCNVASVYLERRKECRRLKWFS